MIYDLSKINRHEIVVCLFGIQSNQMQLMNLINENIRVSEEEISF